MWKETVQAGWNLSVSKVFIFPSLNYWLLWVVVIKILLKILASFTQRCLVMAIKSFILQVPRSSFLGEIDFLWCLMLSNLRHLQGSSLKTGHRSALPTGNLLSLGSCIVKNTSLSATQSRSSGSLHSPFPPTAIGFDLKGFGGPHSLGFNMPVCLPS